MAHHILLSSCGQMHHLIFHMKSWCFHHCRLLQLKFRRVGTLDGFETIDVICGRIILGGLLVGIFVWIMSFLLMQVIALCSVCADYQKINLTIMKKLMHSQLWPPT